MTGPETQPARGGSPFKLLDAYAEQDRSIFFGRDEEIETLYRLLGESRLVLVYGRSGTGKTSLIQCGLTSKFSPTNWLPIMVRRGTNINASLAEAIAAHAITPIPAGTTLTEAIRSIYLDHLRPIYLIFDQFEELFVIGSKDEQERFYGAVQAILNANIACRIIVSLREEYLAALDRFEQIVPTLFAKRLRVEPMTAVNVKKVIMGTTAAYGIALEHGEATAARIIEQIHDNRSQVQLAYMQVYLDHLYRISAHNNPGGATLFTDAEVDAAGQLGDIMAEFLDSQEKDIQRTLEQTNAGVPKGAVSRLLEEFVSIEGTKQPISLETLASRVPAAVPWLPVALDALISHRLIRLVDNLYELAHDALAAHIAERRGDEAKQVLYAERLVHNCLEEFNQTRTWLNASELALVDRALRLRDPIDASPRLRLADPEARFVKKSRSKRRWRLAALTVIWLIGVLTPLVLWVNWMGSEDDRVYAEREREMAMAKASNQTDVLGHGVVLYTIDFSVARKVCKTGDAICRKRQDDNAQAFSLMLLAMEANARRELGPSANSKSIGENFWMRLALADRDYYAASDDDEQDFYADLRKEAFKDGPVRGFNPLALVRQKAVLTRYFEIVQRFNPADVPDKVKDAKQLFDLLDWEIQVEEGTKFIEGDEFAVVPGYGDGNGLGFHTDLDQACLDWRIWNPDDMPAPCKNHDHMEESPKIP